MKTALKLHRFITAEELALMKQHFSKHLAIWNQDYAIEALGFNLESARHQMGSDLLLLKQAEQPLALIDKNYLLLIKECLFAESSACFDDVSQALFFRMLKLVLRVDNLELIPNLTPPTDWLYPGSPCLQLIFTHKKSSIKLFLHPNWVFKQLPQNKSGSSKLTPLNDALATEKLSLTIELKPLRLNLGKLLSLQVDDVIKTAHPLDKPLFLCAQHQKICDLDLSQSQSYKSVQIRRSS